MSRKSLDVLVFFMLVVARVRIDDLADNAAIPADLRLPDVRQLLEGWWPAWSLDRLAHPQTDQLTMLLYVTAFGLLALYLLIDLFPTDRAERSSYRLKLGLVYGIIILLVAVKTVLFINLRHQRGPASYAHDGGVIQTEITIDYFLNGRNPYVEDYLETSMAEWGLNEYRTALYHYPYLPWKFVFGAPFYLAAQATLGWFDMRMLYLPLFGLTLLMAQSLVAQPRDKLLTVALIGLNPVANLSLIFGENDPFVFFWVVLGLWLLKRGQRRPHYRWNLLGSAAYGLACATKPTAWFLAPFWLLYLLRDHWGPRLIPPLSSWGRRVSIILRRAWTLPVVALLIILPWFVWNPDAMIDDVWRWSSGQGETGYQIWGWGASNVVLALGLVENRFEYWPFTIPGAIIGFPLLLVLLWRQTKQNTMSRMLYGYALFLFIFFYLSRFMQPNYLGYILDCLVLAYFTEEI